ncbi:ribosomal protein S5 domain 2-like protein [Exidia glandulosa HHB12029]|uniref:Ribosomal protein S5 domain 2-like protein n=1 Tax=Exidia glandulosa HHB12029 TaxID=1314781 RepID=A0A165K0B3_EXIGL|nr:ribosomal protein S5 domain 2-like protein [Exidia glandulosa HHB12029]
MRPLSPSIPEKEFVLEALGQGLRVDGRAPLEMRQPVLTFGPEFGYVECSLGKTKVICSIDAKMVRPSPERLFEGVISLHSEISPMASTEYEAGYGRPSDAEVEISRMLDKILRRSDAIDKESLCVLAGQRVWHLKLTFHFLSDSGNMLDCACLAGITALRHFRRPEVEVVGEEVIVHAPEERAPLPLAIHHTPLCFTFALFNDSLPALLDPSHLEETLCAGTMSIALNAQKELCVLQKAGGVAMEADAILKLLEIGVMKAKELDKLIEEALAADFATRVVEVR